MKYKVGFIGCGNMASAIIGGLKAIDSFADQFAHFCNIVDCPCINFFAMQMHAQEKFPCYYDYSDYMMKSFIDRSVLRIKEIDPNIKAGLLIGTPRNTIIHRLNEYFPLHRLHVCNAISLTVHA